MTPKEKAKELVDKFSNHSFYDQSKNNQCQFIETKESAKQCALIAVDEIINSGDKNIWGVPAPSLTFWQQVRKEIENL